MKKLTLILAAAGIAALPMSAYAAGLTATTNAATSAAATTASSLSDKSTFADVIGSLSATSTTAMSTTTDFSAIHAGSNISIVLVSKLKGYSVNGLKLSKADMSTMTKLDAKVAANAALTAKLKKAGYLPSDVVAVSVDSKGSVTVFVAK